jgi:hypothetical protein
VFPFKRKQPPILDIDISSTSVKLLELSHMDTGFRVEGHTIESLPPNAIAEKTISDVGAVGESIRKAVKRAGAKHKLCVMAVPSSAAIIRLLRCQQASKRRRWKPRFNSRPTITSFTSTPCRRSALTLRCWVQLRGNFETVDVLLGCVSLRKPRI